jgi:biotin-dependent carboxylase-like uncharacterized protein
MSLRVLDAAGLVTVQDRGRTGLAHLGVPRAGALDRPAAALANRLVGNGGDEAVLEVTLGGLTLASTSGRWVAVTGADCAVTIDGQVAAHGRAEWLPAGAELRLGPARTGVRSYLGVGGGIAGEPVLGSRSTDTLAWVGPARVTAGTELAVGKERGRPAPLDTPRPPAAGPLRVAAGPRADWLVPDALHRLCRTAYTVTTESNRIGLRLDGPPIGWARDGELASEGMVLGAVQVPPDGRPVVFLADHPPTGGYPVLAVVRETDLWQCAQLQPGDPVRFARG